MFEHFLTENGVIYPSYMDSNSRAKLLHDIGERKDYMFCSCKPDDKLYYRLSSDLRFIPCHQHYIHDPRCVRSDSAKRKSAFVHEDEGNTAVVYLKFNPATFTVPSEKKQPTSDEEASVETVSKDMEAEKPKEQKEREKEDKADKEPFSQLANFIRSLNVDCYMDRLITTGKVFSEDFFLSALYKRLHNVRIAPMKKSIKDLDYKEDGYKFFYAVLSDYQTIDKSIIKLEYFGNKRDYFVYPTILQKALLAYTKQYGTEPDCTKEKIMIGGFMYERVSKRGNLYLTPGRIHMFKVNSKGVYCVDSTALTVTNLLYDYIDKHRLYYKCKLYYDIDDISKICELRISGSKEYISFTYTQREPFNSYEKVVSCSIIDENILGSALDELLNN